MPKPIPDCVECGGKGWRMVGLGGDFEECRWCKGTGKSDRSSVAPYGRNKYGVPNRPDDVCVIVIHCDNEAMAEAWRNYIVNTSPLLDALPIPIVEVDCLP